jgi:hypothetical protein
MRILTPDELSHIAGGDYIGPAFPPPTEDYNQKNNNGYGNGEESGPPPGRSGDHNPQLLGSNLGPRGAR